MYTCGTCGRKHTSAQEGRACYERSAALTTQPQDLPEELSPPSYIPLPPKKATPKKATPKKATPKKATPKQATPKKATPKKRKGKKGSAKKPTPFYVKPEERPGSAPARVQSSRRRQPRISPSTVNHAAPSQYIPSGPSQKPLKPGEPTKYQKGRSGKSRRAGEVWQPPSEESKKATPKFDKENREDYI